MRIRGKVLAIVATGVLLAGCSGDDGDADDEEASTTTAAAPADAATLDGSEVLDAVGPAVALVETPVGSGTAVLLEDGHLVTNAHVVDPFAEVEVRFEGAEPLALDVVGVDLVADLAVLGPLDEERAGVAMEDAAGVDVGADLYLVGFPGDTAEPEVTISRGVLSRRREAPAWGLHLLQTDAAIGEGQSGGAVVDGQGRVVGISGLSYDDQFALALTGVDVQAAVEAIVAGDGSPWSPLPRPDEATAEPKVVALDAGLGLDVLYVPDGVPGGQLEVEADDAAVIQVTDLTLYPLAVNEAAADQGAVDPIGDAFYDGELPAPTEADGAGRWTFDVPDVGPVLVYVDSDDTEASEVTVTLSEPSAVVELYEDPTDVGVGDEVDGLVTALGEADTYVLELDAGESVSITVSSSLGDMAFATYVLDDPEDEGEETDDGGGGLLDLDASSVLTADEAGSYGIDVYQVDGYANAYRLIVEPA